MCFGLLFSVSLFTSAQTRSSSTSDEVLLQITTAKRDSNLIKTLHSLLKYYVQKRGNLKINLDSGIIYGKQAISLADSLHRPDLSDITFLLIGDSYLKMLNYDEGKAFYLKAISDYQNSGQLKNEARAYFLLAAKALFYKCIREELLLFGKKSLAISTKIGDIKGILNGHLITGTLFDRLGYPDSASFHLLQTLPSARSIGGEEAYKVYISLSSFFRIKGDNVKALNNALAALQNLRDRHYTEKSGQYAYINIEIARIYEAYDHRQSIKYYNDAMNYALINKDQGGMIQFYEALQGLVNVMCNSGRAKEASVIADRYIKLYPPVFKGEQARIATIHALYYNAVHENKLAEKFYLKAVELNKDDALLLPESKAALSRFYAHTKQLSKTESYLANVRNKRHALVFMEKVLEEYQYYQVDSAKGDYFGALKHYRRYKALNDTVYNAEKAKQIADINIKYRTKEKEQAIRLLKSESLSQRAELIHSRLQRNITLGGLTLFTLISGLVAYGYAQKQRSNRLLILQKKEIDVKNERLEHLNARQETLLSEKEWLLKEIHHRVKNNLQITMSLLSVQTQTTTSKVAKEALLNGQRRLHSMALIHQKLYQSDSLAYVEMAMYIKEMVAYLKDSFTYTSNIKFITEAEQLNLDVAQAVSLGLILNEAITNAIKHAFPDRRKGEVQVKLLHDSTGYWHLIIADNGVGICCNAQMVKNSLGMELFNVLSKQVNGTLCIDGKDGMTVSVKFKPMDFMVKTHV